MSIPTGDVALRDYLLDHDDQYRDLVSEHQQYESRLNELSSLSYPNEDEQLEETVLKKKKLALKDRMEAIATKYKSSAAGH